MIEVGEYVRTRTGNITKVIKIKDTVIWTDEFLDAFCRYNEGVIDKNDIAKHSKNIIDLIEEFDFVNGYPCRIINNKMCNFDLNTMEWTPLEEIDVWESIVTKEQFANIEYRLED